MKNGLVALVVVLSAACSGNGGSSVDAVPLADAEPAPTWANFGDGFFMAYCYNGCHGPADTLRDYSLIADVRRDQDKIRCGVSPTQLAGCTISAGQFPIGTFAKPTDAERERLVRWIDEGTLD